MGDYEYFANRSFLDFSSDTANVYLFVLDCSGSMRDAVKSVKEGMEIFKNSFKNFPISGSISVSVSQFNGNFFAAEFTNVNNLKFSYGADGGTALFYSICEATKYLNEYVARIRCEKGVVPKVTFILFSDGYPNGDCMSEAEGKKAIEALNLQGVTTAFVAFGDAIESKFGQRLGFQSVIDIRKQGIKNFLGVKLSGSCKEQSKSMSGLKGNFFSGTDKRGSKSYRAEQALEDDSWLDDI